MPNRCCAETPVATDDDTAAEEAAAALSALDAEVGRTTDPVRMYMREMGTVELLTREGEIAIAKRIEEGLNQVQTSLASFPWSIQLLLEEYDQHVEGKKRLSEDRWPASPTSKKPPAEGRRCRGRVAAAASRKKRRGRPTTTRKPAPARPVRIRSKSRAAWKSCARCYGKFQKSHAKDGTDRQEGAEAARPRWPRRS